MMLHPVRWCFASVSHADNILDDANRRKRCSGCLRGSPGKELYRDYGANRARTGRCRPLRCLHRLPINLETAVKANLRVEMHVETGRSVIPAQAGIHDSQKHRPYMYLAWVPAFAGTTLRLVMTRISTRKFALTAVSRIRRHCELRPGGRGKLREAILGLRALTHLWFGMAAKAASR